MNSKRLFSLLCAVLLLGLGSALAQQITVAVPAGPPGFDPQNNNQAMASGIYINIFEYLMIKDENGALQPMLATEWESTGPTTWRVKLREGVTWHDGEPFTARDVKFTFERVAGDPTLVRHSYYADIEEVEIVGDHEVIFHTAAPNPIFLSALSRNGASVIPAHYYEAVGAQEAAQAPIGTGPYRFVQYRTDDRLVLERFDEHWAGVPPYEQVTFRVIPETSTAVSELVTGGVQIVAQVETTELERIEGSGVAQVVPVGGNRTAYLTFNVSEGLPTSDPLVRAAVDYAIDEALLVEILQDGYGVPVRGRVSPETSFAPQELYDAYLYDPARAEELLSEAGYGPGELSLTLMGANSYADAADLVAVMLADVGISADIQLFESSVWNSRYWHTGEFEHIGFGASSDSSFDYGNSLVDLTCPDGVHAGRGHWCNDEYTDLVTRANGEFDDEARAGLLREAAEILLEERPQHYLYSSVNFVGVAQGVDFTPRADSLIILAPVTLP